MPQGPGGVIRFWAVLMPPEPKVKRAFAFIDGQNLFFAARQAFGYTYPNYDFPDAFLTAEEKGIDVRIAIDVIRLAHRKDYDVAILFSQDQDLSELCAEIRVIAREQDRWIKIASAFPISPTTTNKRGIPNSDWIKIDRATYDACLDDRDYRPRK